MAVTNIYSEVSGDDFNNLVVTCPSCSHEFGIGDALAGRVRAEFQRREVEMRGKLAERERELAEREAGIEQLAQERARALAAEATERIIGEVKKDAEARFMMERKAAAAETEALREKLRESTQRETDLLRKEREFAEKEREFELQKQRAVNEAIGNATEDAEAKVKANFDQQLREKDLQLKRAQDQAAELKRQLEQKPSQELAGEAFQQEIAMSLQLRFPTDNVESVKKGQRGGDALHTVYSRSGAVAGRILWETKNAANWSAAWLDKLKNDAREAKAEVCVLVTDVAPGIDTFDVIDGVWVVKPEFARALAVALREQILLTAEAHRAMAGAKTKSERIYTYLVGPEFRARLSGIAEPFRRMQSDLASEKRVMTTRWNRREKQIETVLEGVMGLKGDLQGLAGSDLDELSEIEMLALEPENESAE